MQILTRLFLAAGLIIAGQLSAQDTAKTSAPVQRKTAIIVENRAGEQFNDEVPVLEDLLESRVAGKGFSIISRDVAVNALKNYSSAGVTLTSQSATAVNTGASHDSGSVSMEANAAQRDAEAERVSGSAEAKSGQKDTLNIATTSDPNVDDTMTTTHDESSEAKLRASQAATATHEESSDAALHGKAESSGEQNSSAAQVATYDSAHIAATPDTTALDDALNNNTSALRLAQNLGADFILIPAITSYGTEKKSYSGNGIETLNVTHILRVSYKIIEAGLGGAISGGTVEATKTIRQTDDLQTENSDLINELLDDAADQLADKIAESAPSLPTEVAKDNMVSFKISCTMTDPRLQPILISAVGISPDNHVVLNNQPVPVQAMDVTVELDGAAIGSAPGGFKARPGFHKLRLSREGFDDWERTINVYDGQTLSVALQMSESGYERWADTTAFLATLDANRKLTDAEVNKINGIAEFFKNSHYNVDAKNLPNVNIYKSLY